MRNFKYLILLSTFSICSILLAITGEGSSSFFNQTIDNLDFKGTVDLDDVNVKKDMHVQGIAKIEGGKIFNLQVEGILEIEDSIVEGDVNIVGELEAENTQFMKTLIFIGEELELKKTQAQDIILKKPNESKLTQRVRVREGSVVQGNIIFESGDGEVILDNDSRFLGNVQGGRVVSEA
ncbi:hypothetical protein AB751O23_AL_00090 [Chlamydiales bacterium SCGC AB-751-O23]|jgi:hypothetical protein|nr:hypothetical protein AB751O23_AL_00090 [Chlamydiales bacterium SCGC AB-751-O23]